MSLNSDFKKAVKKRYQELVDDGVDEEQAYTQAAIEWLKANREEVMSQTTKE